MTKDEIVDAPLMTEAPISNEASSAAQTVASDEGKAPAKKNSYFGGDTFRWYVIQAFSGFEQRVALTLQERIKIHGMEEYFGEILVPKEKVKERRTNHSQTGNCKCCT